MLLLINVYDFYYSQVEGEIKWKGRWQKQSTVKLILDHTVDTPLAQHLWMGAARSTSQKHTFDIIPMLT